jgi:transaldolase/glucose-6-phosphate isomerase
MNTNPLRTLESFSQSIWLDLLRRGLLTSGEFDRLVAEDGLTGVTSNPSIFEKAIAGSHDYDEAVRLMALEGKTFAEIYEALTVDDIRGAADRLRGVYDRTDGRDGFVSLEVSPHLAHDTQATVSEALRLWHVVDRPNLMIKVPATREGLPAIRHLISDGINVNITLLFGLPRYREVAEAYLAGLEDRAAAGNSIGRVASVASFFLSRIDVLLDPQLEKIASEGGERGQTAFALIGQIAAASAKVAYAIYHEIIGSDRFRVLAERGARTQRLLWASTSTKNPSYSDVKYVEPLIGPETINTLPLETLNAYRDHGRPADRLAEGLEDARSALEMLRQIGIDVDQITQQLEDEGIEKFNKPFDRLMETIGTARDAALRERVDRQSADWNGLEERVRARIERFEEERFAARMWQKDPLLWSQDPEAEKVIRNGLGWLHVAEKMAENLDDLFRFVAEVKAAGISRAVHLGMGGSSMAPIVLAASFPVGAGGIPVAVIDSTDPAAVRRIERENPPEETLYIVASKSGTTAETVAYGDYFYERAKEKLDEGAGGHFVAITDPGTPLEETASQRGYRRVFRNFADIGGRYSALSYFGLLPAALMGVDVSELVERALRMANACAPHVPARENPGLVLGAGLGELALAGRDKVTILAPAEISSLGLWLEQLLAESTGKDGKGILPVAGETLGPPAVYGDDWCFVVFQMKGALDPKLESGAEALRRAGHPVVTILLEDRLDLAQEFFRWEAAVAAAGAVLGINAFDQPNVHESKQNTNRLLDTVRGSGRLPTETPSLLEPPLALYAGKAELTIEETLRDFLYQAEPGDYLAILAYLPETVEIERTLQKIRLTLRERFRVATTVGYGPRYLHSTGQYHKGGPNTGLFLQLTAEGREDVRMPGAPFGFGVLQQAQALGDLQALARHGREIVRIDLGTDAGWGLLRLELVIGAIVSAPAMRKAEEAAAGAKPKGAPRAKPAAAKAARERRAAPAARKAGAAPRKPAAKKKPAPSKKPAMKKKTARRRKA